MVNENINIARVARGFVSEDIYDETTLYVAKAGNNTDGLTWDSAYTSLATAVAACTSTHMNVIRVGAGVWDIATDDYLELDAPIHIIGSGREVTILKNTSAADPNDYILRASDQVIIENCGFRRDHNTASSLLSLATGSDGSVVKNCFFDINPSGVDIKSGWGIVLGHTSRCIIEDCYIHGDASVNWGIYLDGVSAHNTFRNIQVRDCAKGIFIGHASCDDNIFQDIIIHTCGIGLDIDLGDYNIFNRIIVKNNTLGADIEAGATYTAFIDIVFAGCTSDYSDNGTGTEWEETDEIAAIQSALTTIDTIVDTILVDTGTTLDTIVDDILVDTGTTLPSEHATLDALIDLQSEHENVLFVSVNGSDVDGLSWATAYTTLDSAIHACASDEKTIIRVGAGTFDIATADYLDLDERIHIKGSGRGKTIFKNSSAVNTSDFIFRAILPVIIEDCTFEKVDAASSLLLLSTGADGSEIRRCNFDLNPAGIAITTGKALVIYGIDKVLVEDCWIHGANTPSEFGLYLENTPENTRISRVHFDDLHKGVHIETGIYSTFRDCVFTSCTTNIADTGTAESNEWFNCRADNETGKILPANLTGTAVSDGVGTAFGTDTELLAAASATHPFRLTGISYESDVAERHRIRISTDSGTSHFYEIIDEPAADTLRRHKINLEGRIFSKGTRISCSVASESGGSTLAVFIEIIEL